MAWWRHGRALGPARLHVRLPQGTPVYISYVTAPAVNGQVAFSDDVYHRDTATDRLASPRARVCAIDKASATGLA